MSRAREGRWSANDSGFGRYQPVIQRAVLLTNQICFRPDCPIDDGHLGAGTTAIAFRGALTGTAWYHPDCAQTLGIRPTTS